MKLIDILKAYSGRSVPYHMPGHKRNSSFEYIRDLAPLDFTEIDGLDNLHAPDGILKDAQDHAARVFGAAHSFFLVNGTTGGILAAVHALAKDGSPIIMARNCHKSVYNAASLCRSRPTYLIPRNHPLGFAADITPEQVENALLTCPDAACVVITSPTYDGVVSDVKTIAEICHSRGIPLVVDAAHGSHLGFLDPSVPSPVQCGADITVMSLHKTMPSLTQTSILHLNGRLVPPEAIAASLAVFETSSPSYLFLASIDGCAHAAQDSGLFKNWSEQIRCLRESGCFTVPEGVFAYDCSKLILQRQGFSGDELAQHLRDRGIEPEMTAPGYVLLMTGAGDTSSMTEKLISVCKNIPRRNSVCTADAGIEPPLPEIVLTPWEASVLPAEEVSIDDARGRIAADTVMAYPPGIPAIVPGERISEDLLGWIHSRDTSGLLTGSGKLQCTLRCVILPE
ncbi:MAG: aminotransferase class V-fold PLP-dependent enzyme [Clostridia bacterium]|nr:aminotransferase class V-fold PLP-dependent enzyme [Clostridia bacterium]